MTAPRVSFEAMDWACGHNGEAACVQCFDAARAECDALRAQCERLHEAGARLIGAVEACAVAERGGPPVNWPAVDASQDEMRAAIRETRDANG